MPLVILLLSVLLTSCSGTIKRDYFTPSGEGVPFRLAVSRMVYWTHTVREGTVDCRPSLQSEIQDNVPSDDWYVINYKSRWFERSNTQFALHSNGTLQSVNADSTPLQVDDVVKLAGMVTGLPLLAAAPSAVQEQETDDGQSQANKRIAETLNEADEALKEVDDSLKKAKSGAKSLNSLEIEEAIERGHNAIRSARDAVLATPLPLCNAGKLIIHNCSKHPQIPNEEDCQKDAQAKFSTWKSSYSQD